MSYMSSINTDRMAARKLAFSNRKPFCAFCYDLGKPEGVYTSHFVRAAQALNSPIVCPELNACICMGCGCKGHTIRNCNKTSKPINKVVYKTKKSTPTCNPMSYNNIYSVFSDRDSDEDTEISSSNISELTEISVVDDLSEIKKSYASVLNMRKNTDIMRNNLLAILHPKKPTYDFSIFKSKKRYTSWADAESSDEE